MVGFLVSCDENQRRVTCKQLTYALHDQVKDMAPAAALCDDGGDASADAALSVRDALRLEVEAARRDNSSDPEHRLCRAHTGVKGLALLAGRPSALAGLDPLEVARAVFAKALADGLPPVLHVYRLMPLQRICKGDAASVTAAIQELCGLSPRRLPPATAGRSPKRPRLASEDRSAEGAAAASMPSSAAAHLGGSSSGAAEQSGGAAEQSGGAAEQSGGAAEQGGGAAGACGRSADVEAEGVEAEGVEAEGVEAEGVAGSPRACSAAAGADEEADGEVDEAGTRAPAAPLPVWGCGLSADAPAATFVVRARSRHNSGLKMHMAEMAGVGGVPAPHRRVGPSHNPQWVVLVEVFGTTAGVAIVPAEADAATRGFNLAAATETEQERHAKSAARSRAAGMTLEEAQAAVAAELAAEDGATSLAEAAGAAPTA